ncbi:DUF2971 domain-containing protein [Labilibaculum manganireducens]|uniref:DUF2971 domain-containing protein n=1 Tax=Labilibaculum manganireducens TaxID=1940525 RepID=UPI0029F4F893|nr:DUF2971 domain-containing protein [Labilibaculum manganireducens]
MKVYKYRGIGEFTRDLGSLDRNEIYAPLFKDLNDPFEGLFKDELAKFIEDKKKRIDQFPISMTELYTKIKDSKDSLGIYSLSKNYCNELMWAHYADSYQGFCIEYELEKLKTNYLIPKTVNELTVKYTPKPQSLTYKDAGESSGLQKLFATKSIPWEYEKEIRLIFDTSGTKSYPLSALTGIYFGSELLPENKEKLINTLEGRDVRFYEINRKDNSYKLERKLIHENKRKLEFKLDNDIFEILGTNHKPNVENFNLLYKGTDISIEGLTNFISDFRKEYVTINGNIKIFNDTSILPLLNKYPLTTLEERMFATHCIAESCFGSEQDIVLYPYK